MCFVNKDGLWIEGDNEHELIVPPRGLRLKSNVIDDWCGMTKEELQKVVKDALERNGGSIEIYLQGKNNG